MGKAEQPYFQFRTLGRGIFVVLAIGARLVALATFDLDSLVEIGASTVVAGAEKYIRARQ